MRAGPTTQPITAIVNSMEATNNRPPGFSFYRRASDLMFSRNLDNQEPTIRAPNVLDRQQMSSVTGVWNGTELLLFIDGKKQETPIETNVLKTLSSPGSILLGAERHNGVPSWFFNGQLDEIRISNFARYDSNYKLESRFQPDAKTIALYHCDEGSGNILKDSSGNGHDGKVDGAKWVKAEGGTGTQEVASAFKSALRFDEDDRVEIPTLNFDGSHPVTFEARIHLSADPIFNESDGPATFDVATIGGLFGVNRTNWGHEAGWLASMTSKNQGPLHRKIVNEALSGHIAIVYDEKTVQLFFNGKPSENRMTQNNGEEQIDELPEIITYRMGTTLGKLPNIEWANSLQGDLSEIRISNIAQYTEQYQPQVQLEDDEHTVALYHFDEGTGDILKDSSGNGHDGKIVGAKWVKADDITIRSAGADSQPLSLTGNNAFSIEEAEWSEPVNLGNIINTPGTEAGACLSADGLTLYFHSKRAGGMGDSDLWQAKRTSLDQSFGKPTNLGPLINSSATEQGPAISRDGLEMFFYSERPGGLGDLDIWQSKRSSLDAPFGKPINLGPLVNSAELDSHATISPDGKSLFFGSERPGGKGDSDFYIAVRESPDNEFGQAVHLPEISSTQGDFWARFTPDGNAIVFASYRQPKLGKAYLWITNRNRNGTFDDPVHLPGPMNTSHMQGAATFTPNGQQVIFDSARPGGQGGHDIWMCRRVTSDSSWKFDKNSGLSFSTPQARVEVSDFRFQDDRPVTLEAWVTKQKPDTAIVADWYGETRFNLSFTPEPNANYFGKQTKLFGPYPYAVKLNQRMHLAATWNGTSQMLFIDGRPVGNLNINDRSNSFQKQAVDMYIGGRPSSSGKQDWSGFPGVIHQVRISDGILYAGNAFTPEPVLGAGKSTLALYHFNEGAGDVLNDSSGNGHHGKIVNAKWVGTSKPITTSLKESSALAFDGDDYVLIPMEAANLTKEFTLEAWADIEDSREQDRNITSMMLDWRGADFDALIARRFFETTDDMSASLYNRDGYSVTASPPLEGRQHVALVYKEGILSLFVAGQKRGSTSKRVGNEIKGPSRGQLTIGAQANPYNKNVINFFQGRIDEVRVSKIARYTGDFQPKQRFESDEETLGLYHFDEGTGEVLKDSSGNGHDGKIVGAKWVRSETAATVSSTNVPKMETNPPELGTENAEPGLKFSPGDGVVIESLKDETESLTMECWLQITKPGSHNYLIGPTSDYRLGTGHTRQMAFRGVKGTTPDSIELGRSDIGDQKHQLIHVAIVRDAEKKQHRLYVNGQLDEKVDRTHPPTKGQFQICGSERQYSAQNGWGFDGSIHEVRISSNPRYDGDSFTPQRRHETDEHTLALYHFDSGTGDILKDSSGNGHYGKIIGAKWVKVQAKPFLDAGKMGLSFDGQDDRIEISNAPFGFDKPFTYEMYIQPDVVASEDDRLQTVFYRGLMGVVYLPAEGKVFLTLQEKDEGYLSESAELIALGEVGHIAVVWDMENLQLFVNGAEAKLKATVETRPLAEFLIQALPLNKFIAGLGARGQPNLSAVPFQGKMYGFRISNTARYTQPFQPSSLENDPDTELLYQFKDGSGDTLKDSSGNGHDGKIIGAKWVEKQSNGHTGSERHSASKPDLLATGLRFAEPRSVVTTEPLSVDLEQPYTMECWLRPEVIRNFDNPGPYDQVAVELGPLTLKLERFPDLPKTRWSFIVNRYEKNSGAAGFGQAILLKSPLGEPVHIACQWTGEELQIFQNGDPVSILSNWGMDGASRPAFYKDVVRKYEAPVLRFGSRTKNIGKALNHFDGMIHQFRLSSGIQYPASFTPPKNFESDVKTLVLYKFDELTGNVLKDTSGNGYDGKINKAEWVNLEPPHAQSSDSELLFEGKTFVNIPTLMIDSPDQFTVEAIVRADENHNGMIVSDAEFGGFALKANFDHWLFDGYETDQERFDSASDETIRFGEWTHVAGVFDGKQTRLFVNGQPQSKIDDTTNVLASRLNVLIGANPETNTVRHNFRGSMRGVRISISARYTEAFKPPTSFESDKETIALYKFDEGAGDVLHDSSGNGHDGKIIRAKWVKTDGVAELLPLGGEDEPVNTEFALQFDGIDNYVNADSLRTVAGEAFNFELWMRSEGEFDKTQRVQNAVTLGSVRLQRTIGAIENNQLVTVLRSADTPTPDQNLAAAYNGQAPPVNEWVHVYVQIDKQFKVQMYLNGISKPVYLGQLVGVQNEDTFAEKLRKNWAENLGLTLGARETIWSDDKYRNEFKGSISEFRMSSGQRYSEDFTPERHFSKDEATKVLYKFDEGTGDVLKDSSGNGHHGKIVGAKWVNSDSVAKLHDVTDVELAYLKPGFEEWVTNVSEMSVEDQVKNVSEKLIELNPGFDGELNPGYHGGGYVHFVRLNPQNLTDLSPLRAFLKLEQIQITGPTDIEAAKLPLSDLSPLQGLPLKFLYIYGVRVTDLSPLKGMQLEKLFLNNTDVANLEPLRGAPLIRLQIDATQVTDLSPVADMELEMLNLYNTEISDLDALKEMPLKIVSLSFNPDKDTSIVELIKSIKSLEMINDLPAEEFWNNVK